MKSKIFIISGPSGAGEDSILEKIKEKIDFIKPVTTTTREMRPGEVEGKTYYFITKEKFKEMISNDEFLEYTEEDRGNFYGVTKKEIEKVTESGKLVFWKIEYKGVLYVKKIFPEIPAIMINSPRDILRERLIGRGESSEMIEARMEYAKGWEENRDAFDYIVENEQGKLGEAVEKVYNIIK
jgi:guanylate kinase